MGKRRIALVAHDTQKDALVDFVADNQAAFATLDVYATGTTGGRLQDAIPALTINRLKSGPLGGDQQSGAMIASGEVDLLIFFVEPLTAMPHDVDVKALMRLAIVYDIPMALNRRTAALVLNDFAVTMEAAHA